MSREIFDKSLSSIVELGIRNICISGGEALLHPDLLYFINKIKSFKLHLRLYTNAQNVTQDLCDSLKGMDLSPVSVTIYSLNESIHDSITQSKGSLKKTLSGLKLFKENGIPFQISVPIMKNNITGFETLYDYCSNELGAEAVGPTPFLSYTVNHNKTNTKCIPSAEDIKTFLRSYYKIAIERGFSIIPRRKSLSSDNYRVYNGAELTILHDGSIVAGTLLSDISLGNICTDNLMMVWNNSSILNKWRKIDISNFSTCKSCKYLYFCEPNIGDNWVANHDIVKIDKHWCENCNAYYSLLFKLSENGKFLIGVREAPGFVFSPEDIKETGGIKLAEAHFNKNIAKEIYSMDNAQMATEIERNIMVQIN